MRELVYNAVGRLEYLPSRCEALVSTHSTGEVWWHIPAVPTRAQEVTHDNYKFKIILHYLLSSMPTGIHKTLLERGMEREAGREGHKEGKKKRRGARHQAWYYILAISIPGTLR